MDIELEKQTIQELIATWMDATAKGDVGTVLSLMSNDVVFLLPGQPPMRGKEGFAAAFHAASGRARIEGKSDIQEICISGNLAYCWSHLSVTVTPLQGGQMMRRAGNVLSILRKEAEGKWVLFRDANMLTAL